MFKYVEQMRKTALTIMSKTYGAKHKTTGESFYDEYPLDNLVDLLCFEDEEEARIACAHYGITLEGNIIRWRNSKFAEPKDPVKNITLTLKPKKMMRTIECKLNGATRLSVCRGGVSGEGATLGSSESTSQNAEQAKAKAAEQAKKDAIEKARQQKLMEKLKQDEARRREEAAKEEARRKAEAAMKEAERKKIEAANQRELERQQQALEEKKRLERQRQEELRIRREREEAIKRAEEEKREHERLLQLEKQRKEEELKQKLAEEARRKAEAEEYARQQAELERQRRIAYELEQKRLAEEERKRRKAEEEEKKWVAKLESAQKLLVWKLWMKQIHKQCRTNPSIALAKIDPTVTSCSRLTSLPMPPTANHMNMTVDVNSVAPRSWEDQLYQLATACRETCDLSQIIAQRYWKSSAHSIISACPIPLMEATILFKLSVVLPRCTQEIDSIVTSLQAWADSHLQFHHVTHFTSTDRFGSHSVKVQAVATIGNNDANSCSDCDAALFLIPSVQPETPVIFSSEILSSLRANTPRMVILIGDTEGSINYPKDLIDIVLGPEPESNVACIPRNEVIVPTKDLLDDSFRNCCEALIARSLEERMQQPIVRVSLSKLSFLCIQKMLVNLSSGLLRQYTSTDSAFHGLYDYSMAALSSMVNEVTDLYEELKSNSTTVWPANEFVSRRSKSVENYFDDGSHLPCNWYYSLQDTELIEDRVYGCFQYLFTPDSIVAFVASTAEKVSDRYRQQRLWKMLDDSNVVGYFAEVVSLIVSGEVNPDYQDMPIIYLPVERMLDIIETAGNFNPSARAKSPELAEIPVYLYKDPPAETGSIIDSSSELAVIEATTTVNPDITPPAIHKRKPADEIMATSLERSDQKRIRMAQPRTIESDEVQRSKDFTSYLEALLG
jgi:chemotaxis protein histidine kinase CheA